MAAAAKELPNLRRRCNELRSNAKHVAANFRNVATRLDDAVAGRLDRQYEPRNLAEFWATHHDVQTLLTEPNHVTARIAELEKHLREWGVIE